MLRQIMCGTKNLHESTVFAIMAIKVKYHVQKNWMGDPCLPEKYTWIGLTCRGDGVTSRVKSL